MRQYELTVLVHPDLEMNLEPATNKLKKLIEDNGGKITKELNDGKKRLAYPIKGQEYAVYFFYDVELPGEAVAKISGALNIADEFIRHLLVSKDAKKEKYEARRKESEAREGEKEESDKAEEAEEE